MLYTLIATYKFWEKGGAVVRCMKRAFESTPIIMVALLVLTWFTASLSVASATRVDWKAGTSLSTKPSATTAGTYSITVAGTSGTSNYTVSITSTGQITSGQENGSIETAFLTLVNIERTSLGKNPLTTNSALNNAAYLHSKDMGDNNYFSHTSLDGRTPDQRIAAAGYTNYYSLGENIAYAYGTPNATQVFTMWKNSPGHYANMMGDFKDAGLGVYTIRGYTYYTLDLGIRLS